MISETYKMAETLERLGLFNKKQWFRKSMLGVMKAMEEQLHEIKGTTTWYGLEEQLRKAKEETKRQKGGKGVLGLGGSERPDYWRNNKAKSKDH